MYAISVNETSANQVSSKTQPVCADSNLIGSFMRLCTPAQNQYNRKSHKTFSSQYKGVCLYKKKWIAQIRYNNKSIYLGYFNDETEAAKAYDNAAKMFFKEFAYLNFKE